MDIPHINIESSHEWRNWLENNQNEKGAWLSIPKKSEERVGINYEKAVEEALCFGWAPGKRRKINDGNYAVLFSPRKKRSVWSMANKEKAESLILQGRMTDIGMAVIEEAKKNVLWDKAYSSKVRDEMPVDLEYALSQNQLAWNNFHSLANTYRNMFIRWLNNASTEEMRKQRLAEIIKRAEVNIKIRYGKI